ncbi:MAG: tryptophan-rich sensory protein [Verrucomicrobiales bacterium]|nr:tryptophan-rich sensory protein [Verrucomicrobiales bacterium]
MKLWLKILLCVIAISVSGAAGAIWTGSSLKDWYALLEKPPGVPPGWIFGPVWTILYLMMGVSLALFWHEAESGPEKRTALIWFFGQLVLNLAWTPVFFGMHQIGVALLVIAVLLVTILITLILFRRGHKPAGRLLIPYAIWVGYATYLNAGYWVLN